MPRKWKKGKESRGQHEGGGQGGGVASRWWSRRCSYVADVPGLRSISIMGHFESHILTPALQR